MSEFDRSKTLQELEGEDWAEPEYESHLVTNAHRLHRVPLREFTVEDLRFMIGQQFGLPYLIPIALEHLPANLSHPRRSVASVVQSLFPFTNNS